MEKNDSLERWRLYVDEGVDKSSRWHSTQRGWVRTSGLLGDHLAMAMRESVRSGKGGRALVRCANGLMWELKNYERESRLLVKLGNTGRVVQALERTIEAALDILSLLNSPEAEMWSQQLQEEREQRVQLYGKLLGDEDLLRAELGNEQQQLEAQTLLKRELTRYLDVLTPGELDVISAVFDASVRLLGVVTTMVPAWFVTTRKQWPTARKSSFAGGEETCLRDVAVWATLQHPNVRKFYGACHVGREPFVIHQVANMVSGYNYSYFKWRSFLGCARGILYVHERGFVHESLAASHLWGIEFWKKGILSGLGLVRGFPTDDFLQRGSGDHVASVAGPQHPSSANDVLRLGILIFQLLVQYRVEESEREPPETSETRPLPGTKPDFVNDDEWRLLQSMCALDPADRISMLTVVHLMSALANQEESTSDQEELQVQAETVIDVRQYVIQSLNKTTEEVLAKAEDLCADADADVADLHRPVLKRLEDIYRQLLDLPTPPRLPLVESFVIILERWFCSLEHKLSLSQSSVSVICASRTIAGRNYGLHYDIDRLLREYSEEGLDDSAAVHRWQPSWKKVLRQQRRALETLVENPSLILEGMESKIDRSEALALLQSEAQSIGMRTAGLRTAGALNPLPSWFIPPHHVQLGKHLADGSFGAVYEGMYLDSPVVVKQLLTSGLEEERRQFLQEADLWFSLNHENLVTLYGACHEGRPFFVCEPTMGGTIVERAKTEKDPVHIWWMLMHAAEGLQYLHGHGIVHGDLKGNNILVGTNDDVKLADFGLSFATNERNSSTAADEGALGAFRWKAPEVLQGGKPTFASGVYSFAMCIIEAVTGKFPWGNSMADDVVKFNVVNKRLLPQRPKGFTDKQWELVTRMCCYDPEERIKVGAVVTILNEL